MKQCVAAVLGVTITSLGLAAGLAAAHPGHGLETGGVGLLHFLLRLSHAGAGILVAVALAAAAAARKLRRNR